MTHESASEPGRPGRKRFRRLFVVLVLAVVTLLLVRAAFHSHVASRARAVEQRIIEERRATEAAAEAAALAMERYLAGGERGRLAVDGPTLTRFIEGRYGGQVPGSISSWRVTLAGGEAILEGVVDLEQYLEEEGMEQPQSLSGFSGREISFSVRGRLQAEQGRGQFTVVAVHLLGLPLPLDLVERVGRSRDESNVLVQQFDLPRGIERARVDEDMVVINGQPATP